MDVADRRVVVTGALSGIRPRSRASSPAREPGWCWWRAVDETLEDEAATMVAAP